MMNYLRAARPLLPWLAAILALQCADIVLTLYAGGRSGFFEFNPLARLIGLRGLIDYKLVSCLVLSLLLLLPSRYHAAVRIAYLVVLLVYVFIVCFDATDLVVVSLR